MSWLVSITACRPLDVELAVSELWTLGTTGTAETETTATGGDGDTDQAQPAGRTVDIVAGFGDRSAAQSAAEAIRCRVGHATVRVRPVEPLGWPEAEPRRLRIEDRVLHLEVGHAFGHGDHPTTRLALDALGRLAGPGTSVLDVGTGTGILAMAAAVRGAVPVLGIDVDAEATAVARRNVAANDLSVTIADTAVSDVRETFDIVVVNMLAADLTPIAGAVAARVGVAPRSGRLYVTGLLGEQGNRVAGLFEPAGLEVERTDSGDDGWIGLQFERHGSR